MLQDIPGSKTVRLYRCRGILTIAVKSAPVKLVEWLAPLGTSRTPLALSSDATALFLVTWKSQGNDFLKLSEILKCFWMPQVCSFSCSFLSGTLPSCQPNPCTDVPVLGNLFKGNCEGLSTGERCELSCNAPCPIWRLNPRPFMLAQVAGHTFLCTFDKPFALNHTPHTDHTPAQHLIVLCLVFFRSIRKWHPGFGV